jgi:predicted DNA-binding transcriptional regulator YafY
MGQASIPRCWPRSRPRQPEGSGCGSPTALRTVPAAGGGWEPGRLVTAGRRWYLVGYDNDADDWRTFLVDRITDPVLTGQRFATRLPADADPAELAASVLYAPAPVYRALTTLQLPAGQVRERLGGAEVEATGEHSCRLSTAPDTLEWLAAQLIRLGCECEVHEPPELIGYLTALTARVARAAGRSSA